LEFGRDSVEVVEELADGGGGERVLLGDKGTAQGVNSQRPPAAVFRDGAGDLVRGRGVSVRGNFRPLTVGSRGFLGPVKVVKVVKVIFMYYVRGI
jgi:hypothetical protein